MKRIVMKSSRRLLSGHEVGSSWKNKFSKSDFSSRPIVDFQNNADSSSHIGVSTEINPPFIPGSVSSDHIIPNTLLCDSSRKYRYIQLDNGLRCMLVSDPAADVAAAALSCNVGSLNDPYVAPGLHHFLEHLLFLGTKKYPETSEYKRYLKEHGGLSNASTASENTTYYFSINKDYLEGIFDRFSQFFIDPKFDELATDRELTAVNNENAKNLPDDGRRQWQVIKHLTNYQLPNRKFGTGDFVTLRDRPLEKWGLDTRPMVISHFERFYSASIMNMCVVGSQDLDQLEHWVTSLKDVKTNFLEKPLNYMTVPEIREVVDDSGCSSFHIHIRPSRKRQHLSDGSDRFSVNRSESESNGNISTVVNPNSPRDIQNVNEHAESNDRADSDFSYNVDEGCIPSSYQFTETGKFVILPALRDTRVLRLNFPLRSIRVGPNAPPTPSSYSLVSHVLGYEGPGSLLSLLKAEDLADSLSAGATASPHSSNMEVTIVLTPKGERMIHEVVNHFFALVSILHSTPSDEWERLFVESKQLDDNELRFAHQRHGSDLVLNIVNQLASNPGFDAVIGRGHIAEFSMVGVQDLLQALCPSNMIMILRTRSARHLMRPAVVPNGAQDPYPFVNYDVLTSPKSAEYVNENIFKDLFVDSYVPAIVDVAAEIGLDSFNFGCNWLEPVEPFYGFNYFSAYFSKEQYMHWGLCISDNPDFSQGKLSSEDLEALCNRDLRWLKTFLRDREPPAARRSRGVNLWALILSFPHLRSIFGGLFFPRANPFISTDFSIISPPFPTTTDALSPEISASHGPADSQANESSRRTVQEGVDSLSIAEQASLEFRISRSPLDSWLSNRALLELFPVMDIPDPSIYPSEKSASFATGGERNRENVKKYLVRPVFRRPKLLQLGYLESGVAAKEWPHSAQARKRLLKSLRRFISDSRDNSVLPSGEVSTESHSSVSGVPLRLWSLEDRRFKTPRVYAEVKFVLPAHVRAHSWAHPSRRVLSALPKLFMDLTNEVRYDATSAGLEFSVTSSLSECAIVFSFAGYGQRLGEFASDMASLFSRFCALDFNELELSESVSNVNLVESAAESEDSIQTPTPVADDIFSLPRLRTAFARLQEAALVRASMLRMQRSDEMAKDLLAEYLSYPCTPVEDILRMSTDKLSLKEILEESATFIVFEQDPSQLDADSLLNSPPQETVSTTEGAAVDAFVYGNVDDDAARRFAHQFVLGLVGKMGPSVTLSVSPSHSGFEEPVVPRQPVDSVIVSAIRSSSGALWISRSDISRLAELKRQADVLVHPFVRLGTVQGPAALGKEDTSDVAHPAYQLVEEVHEHLQHVPLIPLASSGLLLREGSLITISRPHNSPDNRNAAVVMQWQLGFAAPRLVAAATLLASIISQPAFEVLRTTEQLGYIVHAAQDVHKGVVSIQLRVQSANYSTDYLRKRMNTFIRKFMHSHLIPLRDNHYNTVSQPQDTKKISDFEKRKQVIADKYCFHDSTPSHEFFRTVGSAIKELRPHRAEEAAIHVMDISIDELIDIWNQRICKTSSSNGSNSSESSDETGKKDDDDLSAPRMRLAIASVYSISKPEEKPVLKVDTESSNSSISIPQPPNEDGPSLVPKFDSREVSVSPHEFHYRAFKCYNDNLNKLVLSKNNIKPTDLTHSELSSNSIYDGHLYLPRLNDVIGIGSVYEDEILS